ncbi:hypothetical protein ACFOOP_10560 [Marinicaulis aureus]|uniref:Uncharacterized protein n=1 Tax=Hyphococcus aureus TaxID=2666033 RepID=A0ABW1L3F8_9PROT
MAPTGRQLQQPDRLFVSIKDSEKSRFRTVLVNGVREENVIKIAKISVRKIQKNAECLMIDKVVTSTASTLLRDERLTRALSQAGKQAAGI